MTTTAPERLARVDNLAGGPPDQSPKINVGVESLVAGRQLKCPIYDSGGLLLLAQGSIVTPRFKQLLVTRGIRDVMLSQVDADSMASPLHPSTSGNLSTTARLDSALTQKLDDLIESARHEIEIQIESTARAPRHFNGRRGEPRRTHILNSDERAFGHHQLETRFQQ